MVKNDNHLCVDVLHPVVKAIVVRYDLWSLSPKQPPRQRRLGYDEVAWDISEFLTDLFRLCIDTRPSQSEDEARLERLFSWLERYWAEEYLKAHGTSDHSMINGEWNAAFDFSAMARELCALRAIFAPHGYVSSSWPYQEHTTTITNTELLELVRQSAHTAVASDYNQHLSVGAYGDYKGFWAARERIREIAAIVGHGEVRKAVKSALAEFGQRTRLHDYVSFLTCGRKPLMPESDLEVDAKFLAGVFWTQLGHNEKYRPQLNSWARRFRQELTPNEYGSAPHTRHLVAAIRAFVSPAWLAEGVAKVATKVRVDGYYDDPLEYFFDTDWWKNFLRHERDAVESLKQDATEYAAFLCQPMPEPPEPEDLTFSDPTPGGDDVDAPHEVYCAVCHRSPCNRETERFGVCPICHKNDGYINVGNSHWMLCTEHKVRWFIGENLFSDWMDETPEQQQQPWERFGLDDFTILENVLGPSGACVAEEQGSVAIAAPQQSMLDELDEIEPTPNQGWTPCQ